MMTNGNRKKSARKNAPAATGGNAPGATGGMSLRELGDRLVVKAMRLLRKNGPMPVAEIVDALRKDPNIDKAAREIYESSGLPKWVNTLHFQSINFVRAGLLRKESRIWFLTEEGRNRLGTDSVDALSRLARDRYLDWKKSRDQASAVAKRGADRETDDERADEWLRQTREDQALAGIRGFIQRMDPYEFQNLVAALLRAMGYFIASVSPPGPDGGVDIVAYEDPLGASGARLKVQIRRYNKTKTPESKVSELQGRLADGEVGVFFCTSGFSANGRKTARDAQKRMRLIDGDEFIRLWIEFYPKMSEEGQKRLPLYAVHFLDEESIPEA